MSARVVVGVAESLAGALRSYRQAALNIRDIRRRERGTSLIGQAVFEVGEASAPALAEFECNGPEEVVWIVLIVVVDVIAPALEEQVGLVLRVERRSKVEVFDAESRIVEELDPAGLEEKQSLPFAESHWTSLRRVVSRLLPAFCL